mmetsp:Transcript_97715/g.168467  ORF Transcript_97715/g.168467 Transcript_97715/m.168467 type:complete len:82 (+) Transcript_97715:1976-2221(+)
MLSFVGGHPLSAQPTNPALVIMEHFLLVLGTLPNLSVWLLGLNQEFCEGPRPATVLARNTSGRTYQTVNLVDEHAGYTYLR